MRKCNSETPQQGAKIISRLVAIESRWKWDESSLKQPVARKLVTDRDGIFLGMRWMDFWPGKHRPIGWSLLLHKWNWGISISYLPPQLITTKEIVYHDSPDDPMSIEAIEVTKTQLPDFWHRRYPTGTMLTIARLGRKWRITRARCPFMEASLQAAPLLSKDEWAELGKDNIKIYEKGEAIE